MLVLWDLDHTLVDVADVSREAYAEGFEQATGLPLKRMPDMSGRTDRAIIGDTLELHGLDVAGDLIEKVGDAVGSSYVARAAMVAQHGRVLPGAESALVRLSGEPDAVQSVVTGNMRPIAEVKVSELGLGEHLDLEIGAFGMDAADRWRLIPLARQRAADKLGRAFLPEPTVVVGDTPRDVTAASDAGVRVVAVATGSTSAAGLRAAGAQLVLDDLTDAETVAAAVREAVQPGDST